MEKIIDHDKQPKFINLKAKTTKKPLPIKQ